MLRELKQVRQVPGEPTRRWFKDGDVELVVWMDKQRVVGFQLIVPWNENRLVLTWHEGERAKAAELDDGEGRTGRPKMTPILTEQNDIDHKAFSIAFEGASSGLPKELIELVAGKIAELNGT